MSAPFTEILVPGRGHVLGPDNELTLSPSAVSRVETAAAYFAEHAEDFQERGGEIRFEGGWAEAAAGMPQPPEALREGRLMRLLGVSQGIDESVATEGIQSRTTMENCLHARESFLGVSRLAIVSQLSQADRFLLCARKVFPDTEVSIIEAPGETDPGIVSDEQRLLKQSRILYGWAWNPRTLYIADRAGVLAGRLAGLRPAAKYSTAY